MKWLTNNFSLNMISTTEDYSLTVEHISPLQFKVECKTAKNRLSQMDICQELNLFPKKGVVTASINDEILVAQYFNGELTYKKVTIGDIP